MYAPSPSTKSIFESPAVTVSFAPLSGAASFGERYLEVMIICRYSFEAVGEIECETFEFWLRREANIDKLA